MNIHEFADELVRIGDERRQRESNMRRGMNLANHDSIFGHTGDGVPNPYVPHVHPYPTRYHGYVMGIPVFGLPYRKQSYIAPTERAWSAPEAVNAAIAANQWLQMEPPGDPRVALPPPVPEGLGEPIFCASTGSTLIDAALGGLVGYAVSGPGQQDKATWAVAGAAAGALAGVWGVAGAVAAALYLRSTKR